MPCREAPFLRIAGGLVTLGNDPGGQRGSPMARIAVIDRRADVVALSQAVLVGRGHAVESFARGPAAFESLRLAPPDAVIAGSFEGRPPLVRDLVRDVRALGPRVLAFLLVPGKGDER